MLRISGTHANVGKERLSALANCMTVTLVALRTCHKVREFCGTADLGRSVTLDLICCLPLYVIVMLMSLIWYAGIVTGADNSIWRTYSFDSFRDGVDRNWSTQRLRGPCTCKLWRLRPIGTDFRQISVPRTCKTEVDCADFRRRAQRGYTCPPRLSCSNGGKSYLFPVWS